MRKLKEPQENTEKKTQCNQENTKEQNKKFDKEIEIIKEELNRSKLKNCELKNSVNGIKNVIEIINIRIDQKEERTSEL